ncbi:MAG: dioxygenase [Gammaproteobacteria bacterium]|nr:dioxygenase [Gammaproteobacteria bacterium]
MSDSAVSLFIPHGGGPLPLLGDPGHAGMNRFLKAWPASIAKPEAIVVISAHWEAPMVSITASAEPELLFDYSGFPPETYDYRYPAPGHPGLAQRLHGLLRQSGIEASLDHQRGYDHGLFVPLMLMYPEARIPCVQVSLAASLDAAEHIRIGNAMAGLKRENLLFLGSGFSFHNMQAFMRKRDDLIDPRNRQFESWLAQTCSDPDLDEAERERRLAEWEQAPHARYCHPREEHLLPLQVCYGVGQGPAKTVFQDPVAGFIASAYQWN